MASNAPELMSVTAEIAVFKAWLPPRLRLADDAKTVGQRSH
jgi:hypothetical protein